MHWAEQYLTISYVYGGRLPETGLDCWGLVRQVYADRYNVELPAYPNEWFSLIHDVATCPESAGWREVTEPQEGDAVALGKLKLHHVGVFLRSPLPSVLHTTEKTGVCVQQVSRLRLLGWANIKFYRHASLSGSP